METSCTNIEFAKDSDAIEIGELSRKEIEYNLRWKYRPTRIRQLIRHPSKNVVVARGNCALAGFGVMTYHDDSANLDLLAVNSQFRGRGVGSQIVLWLEKVALTAGITNVFVQVRQTNAVAIRFYERLGFQKIGQIAGYYQAHEAAVIMCKGIRPMIDGIPFRTFESILKPQTRGD